jgi:hypothetical protein
MAEEPSTPYQIRSHLSWLKGRGHQLKRIKPGHDLYESFYPTSMAMGGQDLATYQPNLIHPCAPTQHARRILVATPGGPRYRASGLRDGILGLCGHLMSDKTRCNHGLPRVSDNRHSRAEIHPIAAWHSDSTTRTLINVMITLTSDKLAR